MDNVTHTLLGVAMARAGLAQRFGKGTTLVLAVASNLPDLDALWVLLGQGEPHLSRRLATHSLPGLMLLAAAGATFFHRLYRHLSWRLLFFLFLLAMAVHVFFDLLNSYGVVLLYPLSRTRFELAWVFIIDLVLLGLLLSPAGLGPLLKRFLRPARLWQAALVGVGLYVAACGGAHWQADRAMRQALAAEPLEPESAYVFPEALGPHRFRGVVKEPGGGYRVYLIRVLSGQVELVSEFGTDEQHPIVRQARNTERGRELEWFFKAPVWELVNPDREHELSVSGEWGVCVAYDLRFSSLVISRENPFHYHFRVRAGVVEPLGWR